MRFVKYWISLSLVTPLCLWASNLATQTVGYTIPTSLALHVAGVPVLELRFFDAATNNFVPTTATATYSLSTNQLGCQMTAKLSVALSDIVLSVEATPPSGAATAGALPLTLNEQSILSGISKTKISNGQLMYTLASRDQEVLPDPRAVQAVTITYTLRSL